MKLTLKINEQQKLKANLEKDGRLMIKVLDEEKLLSWRAIVYESLITLSIANSYIPDSPVTVDEFFLCLQNKKMNCLSENVKIEFIAPTCEEQDYLIKLITTFTNTKIIMLFPQILSTEERFDIYSKIQKKRIGKLEKKNLRLRRLVQDNQQLHSFNEHNLSTKLESANKELEIMRTTDFFLSLTTEILQKRLELLVDTLDSLQRKVKFLEDQLK